MQVAQDRQKSMLRMLRMHGEAVCNIGLYLSYALANLHKYLSLDRQMSMLRMLRMHGEAVCNIGLYLSYACLLYTSDAADE